ncbi:MAG: ubiquinol oxidase subunit II [Rhabdochlamydiaceae bacterium]|nr:ubiquinol oxidase subunit II [Rhabdochlamydiaceae bacterium]
MHRKYKIALGILLGVSVLTLSILYLCRTPMAVLNPQGEIGVKEKDLILICTWLMLIVVIPVLIMTVVFAWKYRASNKKAKYDPKWDNSVTAELVWWSFPFIIVIILSVITWKSCHDLDPFKPIVNKGKAMEVQVVALQWKWLFIYPEEKIATINWVQFPKGVPVHFKITADAPMNSFWIPQLGGQIYAMPGMSAELYLVADEYGNFRGSSSNLSGEGFAGMIFSAVSCTPEEFKKWVDEAKSSSLRLNGKEYEKLVEPSQNSPVSLYVLETPDLYDRILMKYMEGSKVCSEN